MQGTMCKRTHMVGVAMPWAPCGRCLCWVACSEGVHEGVEWLIEAALGSDSNLHAKRRR